MKKRKADIFRLKSFPDHMILQILNKLIDLKTICTCKLVSKRFNRIIRQVDIVSFTVNCPDKEYVDPVSATVHRRDDVTYLFCKPFKSAIKSMFNFTSVKSLCIEFPSYPFNEYVETCCLFKIRNTRVRSHLFLSPNAIYDKNGLLLYRNGNQEEEEHNNFLAKKAILSFECLLDMFVRFGMLLFCIRRLRSLEKISIMDSSKKRMLSVCGREIVQVRDCLDSSSETIDRRLHQWMGGPSKNSRCFIPSLELRVSGCVMKGVSAVLFEWDDLPDGDDAADDHSFMIQDDDYGVEDKQKAAAYGEVMTEILKNLK